MTKSHLIFHAPPGGLEPPTFRLHFISRFLERVDYLFTIVLNIRCGAL